MNTERDRFLTEAMGQCWHDWSERFDGHTSYLNCLKCHAYNSNTIERFRPSMDFSTWSGFGILWEWGINQNWFGTFSKFHTIGSDKDNTAILQIYINPDKFADAVYNFLKERK